MSEYPQMFLKDFSQPKGASPPLLVLNKSALNSLSCDTNCGGVALAYAKLYMYVQLFYAWVKGYELYMDR